LREKKGANRKLPFGKESIPNARKHPLLDFYKGNVQSLPLDHLVCFKTNGLKLYSRNPNVECNFKFIPKYIGMQETIIGSAGSNCRNASVYRKLDTSNLLSREITNLHNYPYP